MNQTDIQIKTVPPILVVSIEGNGKVADANRDIDRLYEYIYANNLQDRINGLTIALFYTEFGGKYVVAVSLKEAIPVKEDIKVKFLPEIKCVSFIHEGDPSYLDDSFKLLKEYEEENNIKWQFPVREIYLSSNKPGVYMIEIQIPI